jgi:hypothetical protein
VDEVLAAHGVPPRSYGPVPVSRSCLRRGKPRSRLF